MSHGRCFNHMDDTLDDLCEGAKDAMACVDELRRSVRMLLDSALGPLSEIAAKYSAMIPAACQRVEQSMQKCLKDPQIAKFVNHFEVTKMLRDTTQRWSSDALRSSSLLPQAQHPYGTAAAHALRTRVIALMEETWQRCLLLVPSRSPSKPAEMNGDAGCCVLPAANSPKAVADDMMECVVLYCAIAFESLAALCRSPKGGGNPTTTTTTTTTGTNTATESNLSTQNRGEALLDIQPSPTFDMQHRCSAAMVLLRSHRAKLTALEEDPAMESWASRQLTRMQALMGSLEFASRQFQELSEEACAVLERLEGESEPKLSEVVAMADWFESAVMASEAWVEERHKRNAFEDRQRRMLEAFMSAAAEETAIENLRRQQFIDQHLPYLPKSAFEAAARETARVPHLLLAHPPSGESSVV